MPPAAIPWGAWGFWACPNCCACACALARASSTVGVGVSGRSANWVSEKYLRPWLPGLRAGCPSVGCCIGTRSRTACSSGILPWYPTFGMSGWKNLLTPLAAAPCKAPLTKSLLKNPSAAPPSAVRKFTVSEYQPISLLQLSLIVYLYCLWLYHLTLF